MVLFKRIDIDLEKERERIYKVKYTKAQRAALLKLLELFEAGKWQECLDHANNKIAFPYNEEDEYDEKEHIPGDVCDVLHDLAFFNFYTQDELLRQAKEHLTNQAQKKAKKESK